MAVKLAQEESVTTDLPDLPWPNDSFAMVITPHFSGLRHHLNEQTKTNMTAMVCYCSRAVWKYIEPLDSCKINDNRVTVVTVNRNEHYSKNFEKFVSVTDIVLDLVGHGSVRCRPFKKKLQYILRSKKQLKNYAIN